MLRAVTVVFTVLFLAIPVRAQDDFFANRPAFSRGDLPAKSYARCEELRAMADATPDPGSASTLRCRRADLGAHRRRALVSGHVPRPARDVRDVSIK